MADGSIPADERPLRAHLRARTAAIHARLDRCMDGADLTHRAKYAQFLALQLAAREAIEEWTEDHGPVGLRPPRACHLLAAHLAELVKAGAAVPGPIAAFGPFALPPGAAVQGLAWAIAGSHLGNRAMLLRLPPATRTSDGPPLPRRFLADKRIMGFWKGLLPLIASPVDARGAAPALLAAHAVFARFEAVFSARGTGYRQAARTISRIQASTSPIAIASRSTSSGRSRISAPSSLSQTISSSPTCRPIAATSSGSSARCRSVTGWSTTSPPKRSTSYATSSPRRPKWTRSSASSALT